MERPGSRPAVQGAIIRSLQQLDQQPREALHRCAPKSRLPLLSIKYAIEQSVRMAVVLGLTARFSGLAADRRIHGRRFATRREAMDAALDWLSFYNHGRPHSTLSYARPMQFERSRYAAQDSRRHDERSVSGYEIRGELFIVPLGMGRAYDARRCRISSPDGLRIAGTRFTVSFLSDRPSRRRRGPR